MIFTDAMANSWLLYKTIESVNDTEDTYYLS